MRVIAGSARGMRLGKVPEGTRPLSDRAREGLFASLGDEVVGARCLDLYAGTGAVGIEALSRGAETCTFVDRSREAAVAIRANLRTTRLEDRGRAVVADVESFLRRKTSRQDGYGLVFVDPPYAIEPRALEGCLAALNGGWLDDEGWSVIVTRGQKSPLPAVPVHWAVRRHLRYGDSLLIRYQEARQEAVWG